MAHAKKKKQEWDPCTREPQYVREARMLFEQQLDDVPEQTQEEWEEYNRRVMEDIEAILAPKPETRPT